MRRNKVGFWGLVAVLLSFTLCTGFSLAATEPDLSFGENGFAVKDFGLGDDVIYGLAVQDDGKIISVGYSSNGAVKDLAVARYLPNGDLDNDFSNDGILTLSLGAGDTIARSLVLQDDGKIVLVGSTIDGESKIAVMRLTTEGNPDSSFGDNGTLLLSVGEGDVKTGEVRITPDRTVVVAGTIETDDSSIHSFFAKLNTEGVLDDAFGSGGLALIEKAYGVNINTFVLLDSGGILAGGSFDYDGVPEAGLLLLNENGSIDDSYGIGGESILSIEGTGSAVNDILIGQDGAVLVAGYVDNGNYLEAFVGMLNMEGDFVSEFGESGLHRSTLQYENVANAIALQNDGSIQVAGYANAGQGSDVFLMSIVETTGSLSNLLQTFPLSEQDPVASDDSENTETDDANQSIQQSVELSSAYVSTDVASNDDIGYAIALTPSGNVLTAGSSGNGNDLDFVIMSFASGPVGASSSNENSFGGISTAGFSVMTEPVTDVTRVGAVSGGRISKLSGLSCETCKSQCDEDSEDESCLDNCFTECLTVVSRGVAYGVYKNPIYRDDSEDLDADEGEDEGDGVVDRDNSFMYDTVRSGQTEDGSGLGDYGSDVQEITPDTTYFLRAYAVLSDETVIYGNQVIFKTGDACFIATAAYGSLLDEHVVILREFRDKIMMGDRLGEKLVGMYYRFSPTIAGVIEQNDLLRATVRIILLPVVLAAFLALKTTLVLKLCLLAALLGTGLVVSRFLRKVKVDKLVKTSN